MKLYTKSLLYSVVLILAPVALSAAKEPSNPQDYQLPTYQVEDLTLPVPSKVITPRLRAGQVGEEIKMLFTVTSEGRAIHIRSSKPFSDSPSLSGSMSQVLRKWEFEPALDKDGVARSVKVALPIKIVRNNEKAGEVVRLAMAKPTVLALAK